MSRAGQGRLAPLLGALCAVGLITLAYLFFTRDDRLDGLPEGTIIRSHGPFDEPSILLPPFRVDRDGDYDWPLPAGYLSGYYPTPHLERTWMGAQPFHYGYTYRIEYRSLAGEVLADASGEFEYDSEEDEWATTEGRKRWSSGIGVTVYADEPPPKEGVVVHVEIRVDEALGEPPPDLRCSIRLRP